MQNVNGEGPNYISLCLALVFNLFVVQKLLLLRVWHSWKICLWVYCICKDQDFDSVTRLNWFTDICRFPTCLQSGAREMTCQQSILNGADCMVKIVTRKEWVRNFFFTLSHLCLKNFNIQNYSNHWSFAYMSTFLWKIVPVHFPRVQVQWLWQHY